MDKSYRLVVFDWEGTLGDTSGKVIHALQTAAAELKLDAFDEKLARGTVSLGLAKAVQKLFPNLLSYQQERLMELVQTALTTRDTDVYLIPGARNLVQKLFAADFYLAIASNRGQQSLQRVLHASGMDIFFPVTRTADEAPAKPCPQMLEEIMIEYDVSSENTLMIGDSISDLEMASCAGVDAIGVNFYFQEAQALQDAGAMVVFDDYRELTRYLGL